MINFNEAISGSVRAGSVLSAYSRADPKNSAKKLHPQPKLKQIEKSQDQFQASNDGQIPTTRRDGSHERQALQPYILPVLGAFQQGHLREDQEHRAGDQY